MRLADWPMLSARLSLGRGRLEGFGGGEHGSHFGHQLLKTEETRKRAMSLTYISTHRITESSHLHVGVNIGFESLPAGHAVAAESTAHRLV